MSSSTFVRYPVYFCEKTLLLFKLGRKTIIISPPLRPSHCALHTLVAAMQYDVHLSLFMAKNVLDAADFDEDPLETWIRWMSRATETCTTVERKELLAQGTRHFVQDKRYRNDERYLKLWMGYADLTQDADEVFMWLKSRKIGTRLSLFWAAWAYVLEMKDCYNAAAEKLAQGMARGAAPKSLLRECTEGFEHRMQERIRAAAMENLVQMDDSTQEGLRHRQAGGSPEVLQCSPGELGSKQRLCCSEAPVPEHVEAQSRVPVGQEEGVHTPGRRGDGDPEGLQACSEKPGRYTSEGAASEHHASRSNTLEATGDDKTPSSPSQAHPTREPGVQSKTQPSSDARGDPAGTYPRVLHEPFSPDVRPSLTTETSDFVRWIHRCSIVRDFRQEPLPPGWSRKMSKVRHGSRRKALDQLQLAGEMVDVMGLLGAGAFGAVFSCNVPGMEQPVAVKVEHQDVSPLLPWECYITLQLHERLLCQLNSRDCHPEADLIHVVRPSSLALYRDGCAMAMPQHSSGTLHDVVSAYAKRARAMPELVAMHFAIQMIRFCRAMHAASILHMDLKPDNWLLIRRPGCGNGMIHSLSLIDFGRAIDLSVFPGDGSGVLFSGCCCPSSFMGPAMLEGLPWKFDADLFALGSCIYFALHGTYLKLCRDERGLRTPTSDSSVSASRWRPAKKCRRYWEVDLWDDLFDRLLNVDGERVAAAGDATDLLDRLETSLTRYILASPRRSRDLRDLLVRQDNMLQNR